MIKRTKKSLEDDLNRYLDENPHLREALEVFNISHQAYVSILAATAPTTRTTSSANN